jgi:hypothetical protein
MLREAGHDAVVAAEEPARRPTGQFTAETGERLLGRIESLSGLRRAIGRRTALRPCSDRRSCRVANVEQFVDEGRREDTILVTFLERCADESVELRRRVEFDCDIPNRLDQGDRGLTGYPTVAGDEPERRVDGGDTAVSAGAAGLISPCGRAGQILIESPRRPAR